MTEVSEKYSEEEVEEATLDYFNKDQLATNVWMTKYALKNKKGKFVEKTSLFRSQRKRLLEDFEKDENSKLEMLIKAFTVHFRCNKEQVYEEIEKCSGSLIDLYYIIEEKYKIVHMPYPLKRRGRPKKVI